MSAPKRKDDSTTPPLQANNVLRIQRLVVGLGKDDTLELGLEELHGISLGELVGSTNFGLLLAALGNTVAGALEHDEEIHT